MEHSFSPITFNISALLAWYHANRREMPWRGHPDPYAVWVSEIMLQQTQVDTVRPYFSRFLRAFPTISALAAAADEPLLKAWEGLGYYTRVRNLRKAAQQIIAQFNGSLPPTAEALTTLPGIGPYSAAAIASICFGQPVPVVDGNVIRVFARHNRLEEDFSKQPPRRRLAQALLPAIQSTQSPSDFNQAMMELGALVCTPCTPRCTQCPLTNTCQAVKANCQKDYPKAAPRKVLPERKRSVLLLRTAAGEVLLTHHTGERLLAGFWELPDRTALPFPLPKPLKRLPPYHQTFSHFRLTLNLATATDCPHINLPDGFCWCADPSTLPLTTATRKILAAEVHRCTSTAIAAHP